MKLTLGKMVIETENAADLGMIFEGLGKANVDVNSMLGIKHETVIEKPVVVAKAEPIKVDTQSDLNPDSTLDKSTLKPIVEDKPITYTRNLTRKELASILGVSLACIGIYVKEGMPHDRVNDKVFRYNADECIIWQKKNKAPCILRGTKRPKGSKVVKSDFATWQKGIFSVIREAGMDNGKVCSEVFKRMTKVYGVVWDQVKKDFYRENGYSSKSTLQLAHWLQTTDKNYVNMFDGCLETVISELAA